MTGRDTRTGRPIEGNDVRQGPPDKPGTVIEKPTPDNGYAWLIACDDGDRYYLTGFDRPAFGAYEVGDRVVMGYRSGLTYGLWFVVGRVTA